MVARNFRTGDTIRLWFIGENHPCPFQPTDVLVAYYSSAEVGCFLTLGWEVPILFLDPYVEFKNFLAGRQSPFGNGLLGAAAYFGVQTATTTESKDENRQLAQQLTFTEEEKAQLIGYCEQDVLATEGILRALLPHISDLPQAFLRGRYMRAVGYIEHTGIPIDVETLERLRSNWDSIKSSLITSVDANFHVYEDGHFRTSLFKAYCARKGIPWPHLPSGNLDLSEEKFRDMSKVYPEIAPLKELRATLSQLKLNKMTVGADGRNRYLISPFKSNTGRNQPSNQKAIFGPATWIRNLIKPDEGMALIYIDWEQQEFGIAAALSGDPNMINAYNTGDCYLALAKQAGAVPADATKASHPEIREVYKAIALGTQYGMREDALALRIKQSREHAKALLRQNKALYGCFWEWSDEIEARAMLNQPLETVFGWRTFAQPSSKHRGNPATSSDPNPRSIRNFPVQANGAEMLRIAIIGLVESGIRVCAPVHDAVLIEAPIDQVDAVAAQARAILEKAGRVVLNGFTIRTDAKIVRYPERYSDPRGDVMWAKLMGLIETRNVANTHTECGELPLALWVPPTSVLSYL